MELIYEQGRLRLYYMPTEKFKTEAISVSFCAPLQRATAYRNALIPMVLNRGTQKHPSTGAITKHLMGLYGAGFGVDVDKKGEIQLLQFQTDYAAPEYAGNCPGIEEKISRFLVEVMTNPAVSEEGGFVEPYFQQERMNTDQFIRSEINDKQSYAMRKCVEAMCNDEPFGISEIGSLGEGDSLTAKSLYEVYQSDFLRTMPVRIFCCTRKEPRTLLRMLEENGILVSGRMPTPLEVGYREKQNCVLREVVEEADVLQGKMNLGFRTNVPPDSPDFFALYVMNAIFGGGPQSKLFMNVREKHSLAYYASSRLERHKGLMFVSCGIDCGKKEQTQALVMEQLEDIRRGKITDVELNAAKAMLVHALRSCGDTQFSLMDYYIGQSFLPKVTEIDTYIRYVQQVDKDAVMRVAQRVQADTVYFLTGKEAIARG